MLRDFLTGLELYAFFLAFQGLAQSSAAAATAEGTSVEARMCAGFVFVLFIVGGLGWMAKFVYHNVVKNPRARMVRDEHGFHRWVDQDPRHHEHGDKHDYYSGFCDKYGAFFEDYKDTPASLFCMFAVLFHRLMIGVFVGAMSSRADPEDKRRRYQQTACLVGVSTAFLGYIVIVRPYHVPVANFFESVVILSQIVVVTRNFDFLSDDENLDPATTANAIYYIMLLSVGCMLLRVISVMIPTWCRFPILSRLLWHDIPALEQRKRRRDRSALRALEAESLRLGPAPTAGQFGRAKLRRAVRKLGAVKAFSSEQRGRAAQRGRSKVRRAIRKLAAVGAFHPRKHSGAGAGNGPNSRTTRLGSKTKSFHAPPTAQRSSRRSSRRGTTAMANARKVSIKSRVEQHRLAILRNPHDAAAHRALGAALAAQGDAGGAVEARRRAAALDPDNADAQRELGAALEEYGDLAGAVAAHQRAVELAPGSAHAHNGLGAALASKGDVKGAIAAQRRALALAPGHAAAHSDLGAALTALGDVEGAVRALSRAIDLDPTMAEAHSHLGNALDARGDVEGALRAHRTAIAADPKSAAAHTHLGVTLVGCGDVDGGVAHHRRAIKLAPGKSLGYHRLGEALAAKSDFEGAIENHEHAISLDPRRSALRFGLGNAFRAAGDINAAVAAYEEAVNLDPFDRDAVEPQDAQSARQFKERPSQAVLNAQALAGARAERALMVMRGKNPHALAFARKKKRKPAAKRGQQQRDNKAASEKFDAFLRAHGDGGGAASDRTSRKLTRVRSIPAFSRLSHVDNKEAGAADGGAAAAAAGAAVQARLRHRRGSIGPTANTAHQPLHQPAVHRAMLRRRSVDATGGAGGRNSADMAKVREEMRQAAALFKAQQEKKEALLQKRRKHRERARRRRASIIEEGGDLRRKKKDKAKRKKGKGAALRRTAAKAPTGEKTRLKGQGVHRVAASASKTPKGKSGKSSKKPVAHTDTEHTHRLSTAGQPRRKRRGSVHIATGQVRPRQRQAVEHAGPTARTMRSTASIARMDHLIKAAQRRASLPTPVEEQEEEATPRRKSLLKRAGTLSVDVLQQEADKVNDSDENSKKKAAVRPGLRRARSGTLKLSKSERDTMQQAAAEHAKRDKT